jgi:hypothetical protein
MDERLLPLSPPIFRGSSDRISTCTRKAPLPGSHAVLGKIELNQLSDSLYPEDMGYGETCVIQEDVFELILLVQNLAQHKPTCRG